jgi:hypothetical protein
MDHHQFFSLCPTLFVVFLSFFLSFFKPGAFSAFAPVFFLYNYGSTCSRVRHRSPRFRSSFPFPEQANCSGYCSIYGKVAGSLRKFFFYILIFQPFPNFFC